MSISMGKLNTLLAAMLAVSTVVLLLVINQNRDLRGHIRRLQGAGLKPATMRPGDRVETFTALNLDGGVVTFEFAEDSVPTLLYFLSTTCPGCSLNIDRWNELSHVAEAQGIRVIGVSKDNAQFTRQFAVDSEISFPLFSVHGDSAFLDRFSARVVPQTVLVGAGAEVDTVWLGPLLDQDEFEAAVAQVKALSRSFERM